VIELIEDHLTPLSSILEKPLSRALIASSHRVRRDNLRSILTDQYVEAGNRLFDAGDPRGGMVILYYASSLSPNHAAANSNIGDRHLQQQEIRQSINFYLRAVNIDNNLASIHSRLGYLYLQVNEPARARLHLEEALRVSPDQLQSAMVLADLLSTHPDASIRDGEKALQLVGALLQQGGESNWQVLITAAAAMAASDDFDAAVEACERALELPGMNVEIQQNIRLRLNRYKNKNLFLMAPAPVPGSPPGGTGPLPATGSPPAAPSGGAVPVPLPGPLQP